MKKFIPLFVLGGLVGAYVFITRQAGFGAMSSERKLRRERKRMKQIHLRPQPKLLAA